MSAATWDPDQYQRFAAERRRPFDDLVAGLHSVPGGRVVDLGCGPGPLTIDLHRALEADETVGIDNSEPMLAAARTGLDDQRHQGASDLDGVRFELGQLEDFRAPDGVEVVFANASLHWSTDHPARLAHLARQLTPGGQLAFQVPANHDHPSHTLANALAREHGLSVGGGAATVLAPEAYAVALHDLGLVDVDVRLQVYGFELPASEDVVEWTKGTLLTPFRAQLEPNAYDGFVDEYRRRLVDEVGDQAPYYYAFKRILTWARRG